MTEATAAKIAVTGAKTAGTASRISTRDSRARVTREACHDSCSSRVPWPGTGLGFRARRRSPAQPGRRAQDAPAADDEDEQRLCGMRQQPRRRSVPPQELPA